MTWKTHILGGMQAGILMIALSDATGQTAIMEMGAAAVGSLMLDIDHPQSKISRVDLPVKLLISDNITKVTKHRREVHTVWCSFFISLIVLALMELLKILQIPDSTIGIGVLAFVLFDIVFKIPIGSVAFVLCIILAPVINVSSPISIPSMPNSNKDILLITAAMFAGCISHLLYDTFNPQGIMWLHPIKKKRYSLANIDTSSAAELSFRVFMIVITIAMLVVINPFSNISFEISPITIPDLSGHGFH